MVTRLSRVYGGGIAVGLLMLGVTAPASGQTPFPGGLEIRLLPGFTHERLKRFCSWRGMIRRSKL